MPRSDNYGTRSIGRWVRTLENYWRWNTEDDDPYFGLIVLPLPEWFNTDIVAKEYVERVREEHGVDHEFMFDVIKMTWGSRLAKWEELDKCQRDPNYIVEYFKEHYHQDGAWEKMIAGARREYNQELLMCINPLCLRTYFPTGGEEYRALRHCQNCGGMTMVHEGLMLEGGVPDGVVQNLMLHSLHVLDRRIAMNNTLLNMASTQDGGRIQYRSQRPYLYVSTDIPQLKIGGDHFIRGRVNREVMSESGLDVSSDMLMISFGRLNPQMVRVLELLFSDENIMLDESKAEKFRQEYIDGQWDDEFVLFVNELRGKGTLKVDSSGVNDTLTALYNMAQRASGKKTIIKRTGKIMFPTQEVLENISQPLIEKAFSVTEHGTYTDFNEVFQADEGVAE